MSVNDESGQTSIVNHDTHYEQTINNTDVMLTNYDQWRAITQEFD